MVLRFLPAALITAALLAPTAAGAAAACDPGACRPRTGAWQAPSPQKLPRDSFTGRPYVLNARVAFVRAGRTVRSKYGNTVTDFSTTLRYHCPKGSGTAWSQQGFIIAKPIRLARDGTASVVDPGYLSNTPHRIILKFDRTTFTGRISGSVTTSDGLTCNASASFAGKLRS